MVVALFGLAGGKYSTINKIIQYAPEDFNNYYEPFIGGASMLLKLNLENKKVFINDINSYHTDFYKIIKDNPQDFIKELNNSFKGFYVEDNKELFKKKLYQLNNETDIIKRTGLWYALKKTSHMSLLNHFSTGRCAVIAKAYNDETPSKCIINNNKKIMKVSEYLNNNKVKITNGDYKKALKTCKEGDFVYLDPPYFQVNETHDNIFNEWKHKDNLDVCKIFKKLDDRGCKVMMSNSNNEELKEIMKDFDIIEIDVMRNQRKIYVKEVIIKNY